MNLLIQRVNRASISIQGKKEASISKGLLVMIGFNNYQAENVMYEYTEGDTIIHNQSIDCSLTCDYLYHDEDHTLQNSTKYKKGLTKLVTDQNQNNDVDSNIHQ